jgi:glutathione S-transferase
MPGFVNPRGTERMTDYKLTYFDFDGGRGEPVRIAFHAAGIEFDDNRLSFAEFSGMRASTRFNALPVLEIDGAAVTQSNAMCRYVGKLAGLYPADDREALYCDEVLDAVEDNSHRIARTFGLEGDELRKARETLVEGWLTVFLRGLDDLLARGGLKAFMETRWIGSGVLDHVPADLVERIAPKLAEHRQRIAAEPVVTAYYASRGGPG